MGGKTSKQKIKKIKTAKGEQAQNSKEPKESTENGATATGKPSQNETTIEEHGDNDSQTGDAMNESTTESVEKTYEKDPSQHVTAAESVAVSSERSPVEAQPKDGTNSLKTKEENQTQSPVEGSTKEAEAEKEEEQIVSTEVHEAFKKSKCPENVCLQQLATETDESETDASTAQTEELHTSNQKTEAREEGDSIPAPAPHSSETGAATGAAADVEETTAQDKTTPATVPTEFKWEDGGETVLISGSYDGWLEKIALSKCGDIFTKTLDLPVGEYLYRFSVDGQWVINRNLPVKCDVDGAEKNVITVQPAS